MDICPLKLCLLQRFAYSRNRKVNKRSIFLPIQQAASIALFSCLLSERLFYFSIAFHTCIALAAKAARLESLGKKRWPVENRQKSQDSAWSHQNETRPTETFCLSLLFTQMSDRANSEN